ncbi:hypothetical protein GH714_041866 [Hevea brasiliensis]|uniref:Uncharacterized protein n=1 Tax=Hevea brasiliensis TaxID=3981 RepID=A0A6A6MVB2_HEVBR|nr:hypothetical protein GH714_041866 [Hevea brasiliensis]
MEWLGPTGSCLLHGTPSPTPDSSTGLTLPLLPIIRQGPPSTTNHSKFTGKCTRPRCNGCHLHPSCKSKDKTKGTEKLKSLDVASNYRLINWRMVDGRPGLNFSWGFCYWDLNHLANEDDYLDDDIDGDYDSYWEMRLRAQERWMKGFRLKKLLMLIWVLG